MSSIRIMSAKIEDLKIHKDELIEMMADYSLLIEHSDLESGGGVFSI